MEKYEQSLRDLWESIKYASIHIIGISEEEEWNKGAEKIFEEIMAPNFPILKKNMNTHIQELSELQAG